MRLECFKYQWDSATADIDVNFFSSVVPDYLGMVDLKYFYIVNTMQDGGYANEGIDSENILYTKCSTYSFQCIDKSPYNSTVLIDFFELWESNKYIKFKVDYYDDNNNLIHKGFLYRDGISIDEINKKILNITVLGYEKEFVEKFSNEQIEAISVMTSVYSGLTGLRYIALENALEKNFPTVFFEYDISISSYFMANVPYTYFPSQDGNFAGWGVNKTIHLKTGYQCFDYMHIDKFSFLDSLLSPMGWIWFFYLGKLVIQERGNANWDTLEIDYKTAQINQSVTHNWEQFQVDNVVIDSGSYFPESTLFGEGSFFYSKTKDYLNATKPFKTLIFNSSSNTYLVDSRDFSFTKKDGEDKYGLYYNKIEFDNGNPALETDTWTPFQIKKTLRLTPLINSRYYSGGFDISKARTNPDTDADFYGLGNLFYIDRTTTHRLFYNGTVAESVYKILPNTGRYQSYEQYSQSETFKNNFKKFMRTNDNVIMTIRINQLITNPCQTVRLLNNPYKDYSSDLFTILELKFNERTLQSELTLQLQ